MSFRQRYSDKHYTKAIATHMAYSTNTGLHFCRDYKSRYRSDKVNGPIFFSSREHRHFFDFYPLLYLLLQTNDEIFRAARICKFLLPWITSATSISIYIFIYITYIYIFFENISWTLKSILILIFSRYIFNSLNTYKYVFLLLEIKILPRYIFSKVYNKNNQDQKSIIDLPVKEHFSF